jgi:hypothetical protein
MAEGTTSGKSISNIPKTGVQLHMLRSGNELGGLVCLNIFSHLYVEKSCHSSYDHPAMVSCHRHDQAQGTSAVMVGISTWKH